MKKPYSFNKSAFKKKQLHLGTFFGWLNLDYSSEDMYFFKIRIFWMNKVALFIKEKWILKKQEGF